ncbi:hypothetical protein FB451DRAFT_269387 [Mycena latifolia]|nr:hypothetical protein FB451DRAFT_269387 [Mycena latifolia]
MFLRRLFLASAAAFVYLTSVETPAVSDSVSLQILAYPSSVCFDDKLDVSHPSSPANSSSDCGFYHDVAQIGVLEIDEPPVKLDISPGVASPFDIDLDNLDQVFTVTLALARLVRARRGGLAWDSSFVELLKILLFLVGMTMRMGMGLGEGLESVDQLVSAAILRASVDAAFSLLVTLHRALRRVGILRSMAVSILFPAVQLPFDVPLAHLFYALAVNGWMVTILAQRFTFVRVVLRSLFPPPTAYCRRTAKRSRKRAKRAAVPQLTLRRARRFAIELLESALLSAFRTALHLPFDVPLAHILYALASNGCFVSVLAARFAFVNVALRVLFPAPATWSRRRETKRYKRRAKNS